MTMDNRQLKDFTTGELEEMAERSSSGGIVVFGLLLFILLFLGGQHSSTETSDTPTHAEAKENEGERR
jgi:hypothetical protein